MLTWQPDGDPEACVEGIAVCLVSGGHCHDLMAPEPEQAVQVCTRTTLSGRCKILRGHWPASEGDRQSTHHISHAAQLAPWRNLCANEHNLHVRQIQLSAGHTAARSRVRDLHRATVWKLACRDLSGSMLTTSSLLPARAPRLLLLQHSLLPAASLKKQGFSMHHQPGGKAWVHFSQYACL